MQQLVHLGVGRRVHALVLLEVNAEMHCAVSKNKSVVSLHDVNQLDHNSNLPKDTSSENFRLRGQRFGDGLIAVHADRGVVLVVDDALDLSIVSVYLVFFLNKKYIIIYPLQTTSSPRLTAANGLAAVLWPLPIGFISWGVAASEVRVTGVTLPGSDGDGDGSEPVGVTDGRQVAPPLSEGPRKMQQKTPVISNFSFIRAVHNGRHSYLDTVSSNEFPAATMTSCASL